MIWTRERINSEVTYVTFVSLIKNMVKKRRKMGKWAILETLLIVVDETIGTDQDLGEKSMANWTRMN